MKEYHKPKIELKGIEEKDILTLSGEDTFNTGWFKDTIGGND